MNPALPQQDAKILVFLVGSAEYGLPIHTVREIIGSATISPMPFAEGRFLGVVGLRGHLVPVLDLGCVLGGHATSTSPTIVIAELPGRDSDDGWIGFAVDAVKEILHVKQDQWRDPPRGFTSNDECLTGVVEAAGRIILVLETGVLAGRPLPAN